MAYIAHKKSNQIHYATHTPVIIANALEPDIEQVPVRFGEVALDGCEK